MRPSRAVMFLICAAAPAVAQDTRLGTDLTARFEHPKGFQVTQWASSPQLYNPTAIDVDWRGRIWVTEAVDYRAFRNRAKDRLHHPRGERVMILEDTDGDGACNSSKVFVQDEDLVSPLGIAVIGHRVLVSCSPSLIVYTDADGDDHPDRKDVLLTGFGGRDHDHGLHSVTAGPDGRLYFNAGNAGPHIVTDRGGWTLRSGSIYRGGGAKVAPNRPGLRSDDGRIWTGGIVMRVDPDGKNLTVLAHNFRNPYEVALDSFGNLFQSDNDDDGNRSCRTLWVMEGGNFGYFSADGSRSWQVDRRPDQKTTRAHWHQDDPGVVPAGTINGGGGPTGVVVYEEGYPELRGLVLNCDAGRNLVYAHRPRAVGAGYTLEPGVFLASKAKAGSREARWFRPSDVAIGPDGSVFVADWWDAGVGGHAMADKKAFGRILRIARPGGMRVPRPDLQTVAGALSALHSPAVNVRALGRQRLLRLGARQLEALLAKEHLPRRRARLLWVLARHGGAALEPVRRALSDPDAEIRVTAWRALRMAGDAVLEHARRLVKDPFPAVRREIAIALRDVQLARCKEILLELARPYEAGDRFQLEALGLAFDGKEEAMYPALLAELGDHPARWSAAFADLIWRLHPRLAVPALAARASSGELLLSLRRQAIDALAFVKDPSASKAMHELAENGPKDLRPLARWWLEHRARYEWKGFPGTESLALPQGEPVFASGLLHSGRRRVAVDVTGMRRLWLVVTDGGNGNSCDWADWLRPRLVGPDGEVDLTELAWTRAAAGWGQTRKDRAADGRPMRVAGERVHGIGTHASSVIVYDLPSGHRFEKLLAEVAPDDGGTSQHGGTSIEFKVYVAKPGPASALLALGRLLLARDTPSAARARAARELAGSAEGGRMLMQLRAAEKLSPATRRIVGPLLRRNPDRGVRILASTYFRRPGAARLPPIAEIATLDGSVTRGRKAFFGPPGNCVACHAFAGKGMQIGPDLTEVRKKLDAVGLLEALVNPSGAIAFSYESWVLELDDGSVVSGFLLADGDSVVLKDLTGKLRSIEASRIAKRTKSPTSIMPEAGVIGLTAQQLADLVSFLEAGA